MVKVSFMGTLRASLWFPRICSSENLKSLQRFHSALDDEDVLLLQLSLQPFVERRQEPSRSLCIGREHAVNDDGIPIGHTRHCPKAFVGLGKKVRPPN
jgi:hypothetical protein